MLRGLAHDSESGPQVSTAYTAGGSGPDVMVPPEGGASDGTPTETAVSTTSTDGTPYAAVNSHLDSFFASHALTREDVLVVAAVVQMLAWAALLYLEVSD